MWGAADHAQGWKKISNAPVTDSQISVLAYLTTYALATGYGVANAANALVAHTYILAVN